MPKQSKLRASPNFHREITDGGTTNTLAARCAMAATRFAGSQARRQIPPVGSDRLCCGQYLGKRPMTYAAPLADMRLVLDTLGNLSDDVAEVADAVLGEAARFAENELAPLNQPGDRIGSVLENGVVRTPPGFREAYRKFEIGRA